MAFNFDKALKEGAPGKREYLTSILLGQQGAGKSRLIGTLGVPTLYLHSSGEAHGPVSAASAPGSNVVPVCWDYDEHPLTPDESFQRLLDILKSVDKMRELGIKAIAIDSATEVEAMVRSTEAFIKECRTKDGGHNTFGEPSATLKLLRQIMQAAQAAQRSLGAHLLFTCALDVKDRAVDGEITEASPTLLGYSVAETFVRTFFDVLVVGEMERDGEVKHKLQFGAEISKVSKDPKKGTVKKMLNLRPRVTGWENPPDFLDADLKLVIKGMGGAK